MIIIVYLDSRYKITRYKHAMYLEIIYTGFLSLGLFDPDPM